MSADTPLQNKRGPYRSPRQEERQRRILATARTEITRVGYDAITMQQLAGASDVSTKTLYNLYGSKDELLLAAVAELLGNLEHHPRVLAAPAGIPALLAFTEVICEQIVETPRYAEVMAKSLFQADRDHRLVEVLLGNTQKVAGNALEIAAEQGCLREGVDIAVLSNLLAGHQWGLVLMWSKGLVSLADLANQALQSQVISLIPACRDVQKKQLESRLELLQLEQ